MLTFALKLEKVYFPETYFYDRNSTNLTPGVASRTSMILTLPYHLIRLGVSAELAAYKNYTEFAGDGLAVGAIGFHFGTFW